MVNVINSCHHPAAALSLAGPQRFSSMVLLSLIKASKCEGINTLTLWSAGNKHQQCCSLRLWEIQASFSSSVCWKSIPNEEGRWKINETSYQYWQNVTKAYLTFIIDSPGWGWTLMYSLFTINSIQYSPKKSISSGCYRENTKYLVMQAF